MLYDSTVHIGTVGHQHVEHIYYASVPNREIAPGPDEASADAWGWYTASELRDSDRLPTVVQFGVEAIEAAEEL